MQHRMTIQRTLLLDTIKHLEGHVTAEQIYALSLRVSFLKSIIECDKYRKT